jgi:hypothetical protein
MTSIHSLKELLLPGNRYRFFAGLGVAVFFVCLSHGVEHQPKTADIFIQLDLVRSQFDIVYVKIPLLAS